MDATIRQRNGVTETRDFGLPDGRRIAYAEWGDPHGFPCLLFHGSPGSRLFGKYLDESAKRAGLRLVAPDRPGFGRSDPVDPYTILGVAEESLALIRSQTPDRFAVVGVSGGAPYVYAASVIGQERIDVAGIISGLAPIESDEPAGRNTKLVAAIRSDSESTLRMLRLQGRVLRRVVRVIRRMPRAFRAPFNRAYARQLPPADREILMKPELADIGMDDLAESLRQGSEAAFLELVAQLREPWGFELDDVKVPVLLWHGTEDQNALCSTARRAADALPRCDATYYEGEGHLMFVNHADEILTAIARATVDPSASDMIDEAKPRRSS
jgi:pimeloyl-ACP methyl ester carboxylesterase